ncbi:MAG TPA: four helix bundle protein [Patescibacteria group bacterium]|nr:four helix bundle protein [Patescibacteria group bacterium]
MNDIFRFEKLIIWKDAIIFAKKVYVLAEKLPKHELFGLISQLKRAAVSIFSNIAEGSASTTVNDFCHFLDIAIKSTTEVVAQLKFAVEMGYLEDKEIEPLYKESQILIKKIQSFKKSLRKGDNNGEK